MTPSSRKLGSQLLEVREQVEGSEPYQAVVLHTVRGEIKARFYPAEGFYAAVVWVGGAGGGWDTPARELYPQLCKELTQEKIASLRVRFRNSRALEETVFDVQAGLAYLQQKGVERAALVGHSLGGASVIRAAAGNPVVRTVVALATQSYGTESVTNLVSGCSILLLHGTADPVLPSSSSRNVYRRAHEPKQIILYPEAGHVLDEVAKEVREEVRNWILKEV